MLAARMAMGRARGELPPLEMRLATTRGTNALLERRGAPVCFFVTRGFGDLLVIGDQRRPDLFDLCIRKPPPLHEAVVEVDERLAADGSVVRPIDLDAAAEAARAVLRRGVRSAAVALLNSYRNADHERGLARRLREVGFEHVCSSSELAPLIKLLPRARTAVTEAYLGPVLSSYLERVSAGIARGSGAASSLHLMTSAGGLVRAESCRARDLLLSGPAGGVAGAAAAGRRSGFERVIAFDMGGTSTDVARFDGDFEYRFEHRVGDAELAAPALCIESVAAGGGSICALTDAGLAVGPRSAAADPGPACYGAGGPLTLTDVNLLLGRLDPDRFEIPVSRRAAEEALGSILPPGASARRDGLLEGFLRLADERMADAIAEISVRAGYDPRDYALVAFGGAGGQHACAVAERLGIQTIVLPADASLLSALGLGNAVVERFAERQVLLPLRDVRDRLGAWLEELAAAARSGVAGEGVPPERIVVRRRIVNARLLGQESSIAVEDPDGLERAFQERYRAVYGHAPQGELEIESIRVVASSLPQRDPPRPPAGPPPPALVPVPRRRATARFGGAWREVEVFERRELAPGSLLEGPVLVFEPHSGVVIEDGWRALVDRAGALVLRRAARGPGARRRALPAAVRHEIFAHRLAAIARQMGRTLERTALSTNVKERLDFSCAVLDAEGTLVVNAPHIPVHLGALGSCVRGLRAAIVMDPGDVVATNHPAFGGSHLPDVTVVTPVFDGGGTRLGYVASRAHHAEIGGTRPGSMPPLARNLAEEGVVIPPIHVVRRGEARFGDVEKLLGAGEWPSRAVRENLADLRAAVAANQRGAEALRALAEEHGAGGLAREMAALEARAARLARSALRRLPPGRYRAVEVLDDGREIRVAVDVRGGRAVVDFAGTAPVHPGNLNATPAVVASAVIYVLRALVGGDLPLNEGLMRAITLRIPRGSMLDPDFGDDPASAPAVGGGNVETSQRIVDGLLRGLGVCAGSQGTMNNVLFGTERFSFYETICGGAGATPDCDGADAVHTHMTNTRITDPEILEHRYPVRVEQFAVRRGSGGGGRRRGGDGAVREMRFLAPMSLSVLTQHRTRGPQGGGGGCSGLPGAQRIARGSGATVELAPIDGAEIVPGDRLVVETPGGGGWGGSAGPLPPALADR